jgi:hypothetical protein
MNWIKKPSFVLSAVTVILFAWVLDFWSQPKACFESPYVAKLTWGKTQVSGCGFEFIFRKDAGVSREELLRLEQKIDKVGRWLAQFGGLKRKINLVIDVQNSFTRDVTAETVILGVSYVKAEGQFQRALLEVWGYQRLAASRMSHPLSREVMLDVLMMFFEGELRLQDPRTGLYMAVDEREPANWIFPAQVQTQTYATYGRIGGGNGRVPIQPMLLQKFQSWFNDLTVAQKARATYLLAYFWQTTDWPQDLEPVGATNSDKADGSISDKEGWERQVTEVWEALVGYRFS